MHGDIQQPLVSAGDVKPAKGLEKGGAKPATSAPTDMEMLNSMLFKL